MKLGIGSFTYGWQTEAGMTPFELLDEAEGLGVSLVQIADNMPLHVLTGERLKAFAAEAVRRRIRIEVGTRGIGVDHLRRYLEIALAVGSPLLRVVVDTVSDHPTPEEVAERLRVVMPDFEAHDVVIAIENHDRFQALTLRNIMQEIESPCAGICLDTANSIGANEGVDYVLDALAPWVVNLHLKDIAIRRLPHSMGFHIEGAIAGRGALDVPRLLSTVRRTVPRDVNAILELWTPPEHDPSATIEKENRWASDSVAYMRTMIGS